MTVIVALTALVLSMVVVKNVVSKTALNAILKLLVAMIARLDMGLVKRNVSHVIKNVLIVSWPDLKLVVDSVPRVIWIQMKAGLIQCAK